MPYLNLEDYDQYVHLVQLFLAAHPQHQEPTRQLRGQVPGAYFFSAPMIRAMAAWARERHLIRRKDAQRVVQAARKMEWWAAGPAALITLTPRVMGTPPRLQPSVLSTEMFQWLKLEVPDITDGDEVLSFTLPAALEILAHIAAQPETDDDERQRAAQLIAWLEAQRKH